MRDTSPPPVSDDSAIGSVAGCGNGSNSSRANQQTTGQAANDINTNGVRSQPVSNATNENNARPNYQNQIADDDYHHEPECIITQQELQKASRQMRYNNTTLLTRSIRTNLACFDDLETNRIDYNSDFLVNFISIGVNQSQFASQRPVSILWPDTYDKMIDHLAKLDAYLINTRYKEQPIQWMLNNGLTTNPDCSNCKQLMTLSYEGINVAWRCNRTQICQNLYSPIQRPITFKGYENVGLMKILFSIYYWSICTQCDLLYTHLKMEPKTLNGLWRSIQNVCRVALEKSYPRFRFCNNPNSDDNQSNAETRASTELIDLISVKFHNSYIVCAKHPRSNAVRLGLHIPKVSRYSCADLVDSWFASGAEVRVCEKKFLDLAKKRADVKITLVSRCEMIAKNGSFHRESAFGYIICQLTHIFKDFDSRHTDLETLKLILAELEWRELYGTNPYDAFTKIVEHMAVYRGASDCYVEPVHIAGPLGSRIVVPVQDESEFVFAEKYFYASLYPLDHRGKVIQRYGKIYNQDPVVQFRCHLCPTQFESYFFSMHMVAHAEVNRKENDKLEYTRTKQIKCKHCFKKFNRDELSDHNELFRTDFHTVQYGCRICCRKYKDRVRYLEHMRRTHFEHELPYRCPSCRFASSFQRETIIHFQEEHQHEFILLCPFCFRSYTVARPEKLDLKAMDQVSLTLYNHILEHYALADSFSCDNCCLSFLTRKKLEKHKALHHNPSEIFDDKKVKLEHFIVTCAEEPFCVRALQTDLFIPNKRPNLAINEASQAAASTASLTNNFNDGGSKRPRIAVNDGASTSQVDVIAISSDSSDGSDDSEADSNDCSIDPESETIHVRFSRNAQRFLDRGSGSIHLSKTKNHQQSDLSAERMQQYMSRMQRADCIIPNQSVILTPTGRPSRCVECFEYVTVDHYVGVLTCKPCRYVTHCPIANMKHMESEQHRLRNLH